LRERTITKEKNMKMRRMLVILAAACATLAVAVPVALAISAHFVSASATVNSSGQLVVSWKEAGLGDNVSISYTTTADATATYVCVNGGNKNPSAANKTTVSGPVSASGTFSSGKNGNITASLTTGPPSAGSFSCPSGQKLELASVTYTNLSLEDTTNMIFATLPSSVSSGCLLPNVKGACS
jgi:hypothetical protein